MLPTDFTVLAELQAAKQYTYKVLNSNEMTMQLLAADILDDVLDAPSGVLRGFALRLGTESNFDFTEASEDGQANLFTLDYLISNATDPFKTKLTNLRNAVHQVSNSYTTPYADWTQEQLDAAHAEKDAQGVTKASEIFYGGISSTIQPHLVNASARQVKFAVIFDTAPTYDNTTTIILETETVIPGVYAEEPHKIKVWGRRATQPAIVTITNLKGRRWRVKSASCSIKDSPFQLDIFGA